jgi:hypothetical protein
MGSVETWATDREINVDRVFGYLEPPAVQCGFTPFTHFPYKGVCVPYQSLIPRHLACQLGERPKTADGDHVAMARHQPARLGESLLRKTQASVLSKTAFLSAVCQHSGTSDNSKRGSSAPVLFNHNSIFSRSS